MGTGSMDHMGVQPCSRHFDTAFDPTMYMWNGFLEFFCHELTQILEYNEGLFPNNSIHWEDKPWKLFPLIVAVLTTNILIFLLPYIHEIFLWLLTVGVCIWVSKYDVNYGISLDFPLAPDGDTSPGLQSSFPHDVPPHMIYCSPGWLGVLCVNSLRLRLIERGTKYHHALRCDVQWQVLHG